MPPEERYSLVDQIRRSSRAVNALLAEAWAKRTYPAAFVSRLDDALGEANETQAWLDHALDSDYIDPKTHNELDTDWQSIGGGLTRMMQMAESFCRSASTLPPPKR